MREFQRWEEKLVRMKPIPAVYFQCSRAISAITKLLKDAIAFVPPIIIERPWLFTAPQDKSNWCVVEKKTEFELFKLVTMSLTPF